MHLRLSHIPIANDDRSVRVSTAAAMLDCDESMIRKLAKDGELEWHRFGKRGVRIFLASISDYQVRMTGQTPAAERQSPRKNRTRPSARHNESMAYLKSMGLI